MARKGKGKRLAGAPGDRLQLRAAPAASSARAPGGASGDERRRLTRRGSNRLAEEHEYGRERRDQPHYQDGQHNHR
jgi:hypothetical protein